MGNCLTNESTVRQAINYQSSAIQNTFKTLEALKEALEKRGIDEGVDIAFYIDVTGSNSKRGSRCSDKQSPYFDPLYRSINLHDVIRQRRNSHEEKRMLPPGGMAFSDASAPPPPSYQQGEMGETYTGTEDAPSKYLHAPKQDNQYLRRQTTRFHAMQKEYESDNTGQAVFSFVKPPEVCTPYEYVMQIVYFGLIYVFPMDKDRQFPFSFFGDTTTVDKSVCSFSSDGQEVTSVEEMITLYENVVPGLTMSGPTTFAPAIYDMIDYVKKNEPEQLHVMVIICDGAVGPRQKQIDDTRVAIREASNWPIEILIFGVGDGPWDEMEALDDTENRRFDNVQFIPVNDVRKQVRKNSNGLTVTEAFFLEAMQELPLAVDAMLKHGILR
jgi:hypothetical protein